MILPDPLSFAPTQQNFSINTAPTAQRASLFESFTFHFVCASSPYIEIVQSARGSVFLSDTCCSAQADSFFVVFRDVAGSSESVLTDTQALMMNRSLSEEVLEWVQKGWLPLEEQELMKCVLHPEELADGRLTMTNTRGTARLRLEDPQALRRADALRQDDVRRLEETAAARERARQEQQDNYF